MSVIRDCATQVAAAVTATSLLCFDQGGLVAAAAPLAAGTTLGGIALWHRQKWKGEISNSSDIERLVRQLKQASYDAISKSNWEKFERSQAITRAAEALIKYLPDIPIENVSLAKDSVKAGGFPHAATARILQALSDRERKDQDRDVQLHRLFGPDGLVESMAFAEGVIRRTFEAALFYRPYWEKLEPHIIREVAEKIGAIDRKQDTQLINQKQILAYLEEIRVEVGLSKAQVESLLMHFGHEGIPKEQWESALRASAKRLKDLEAKLSSFSDHDDPEIRKHFELARGAVAKGGYELADHHIELALEILTNVPTPHHEKASEGFSHRGELAFARGRYIESADLFGKAASHAAAIDSIDQTFHEYNQATALLEHGKHGRDIHFLTDAVKILQKCGSSWTQEKHLENWAKATSNLGMAYLKLAIRSNKLYHMAALSAFDEVLGAIQPNDQNEVWTTSYLNKAVVLTELGKSSNDLSILFAARDMLQDLSSSVDSVGVSLNKFTVQNSLALNWITLAELGHYNHLKEAIELLGALTEQFDASVGDTYRAQIHCNLGNALSIVGSLGDVNGFSMAIESYQKAIALVDAHEQGVLWARAQNGLGNALFNSAQKGDADQLFKSIQAFEKALVVIDKQSASEQWAQTQGNLGAAYATLGELDRRDELKLAQRAFREALSVYKPSTHRRDWCRIQNSIGNTWRELDKYGEKFAFERAAIAFGEALTRLDADTERILLGMALANTAVLLEQRADRTQNRYGYEASYAKSQKAVAAFEKESPAYANMARQNLIRVRQKLENL